MLVGFLAWLILVPLGITSAHAIRKKMGRNWRRLHKLTYAVAFFGVATFAMAFEIGYR